MHHVLLARDGIEAMELLPVIPISPLSGIADGGRH